MIKYIITQGNSKEQSEKYLNVQFTQCEHALQTKSQEFISKSDCKVKKDSEKNDEQEEDKGDFSRLMSSASKVSKTDQNMQEEDISEI